jgi:hypothetical protein
VISEQKNTCDIGSSYKANNINVTRLRLSLTLRRTKQEKSTPVYSQPLSRHVISLYIQERQEQKGPPGISWDSLVLHNILNNDCLCTTCQVCQTTKKDHKCKKYELIPPKIAESDTYPWFMACVDIVNEFTIRKSSKTSSLIALRMIDTSIHHRLVWKFQNHKEVSNIHPGFVS